MARCRYRSERWPPRGGTNSSGCGGGRWGGCRNGRTWCCCRGVATRCSRLRRSSTAARTWCGSGCTATPLHRAWRGGTGGSAAVSRSGRPPRDRLAPPGAPHRGCPDESAAVPLGARADGLDGGAADGISGGALPTGAVAEPGAPTPAPSGLALGAPPAGPGDARPPRPAERGPCRGTQAGAHRQGAGPGGGGRRDGAVSGRVRAGATARGARHVDEGDEGAARPRAHAGAQRQARIPRSARRPYRRPPLRRAAQEAGYPLRRLPGAARVDLPRW